MSPKGWHDTTNQPTVKETKVLLFCKTKRKQQSITWESGIKTVLQFCVLFLLKERLFIHLLVHWWTHLVVSSFQWLADSVVQPCVCARLCIVSCLCWSVPCAPIKPTVKKNKKRKREKEVWIQRAQRESVCPRVQSVCFLSTGRNTVEGHKDASSRAVVLLFPLWFNKYLLKMFCTWPCIRIWPLIYFSFVKLVHWMAWIKQYKVKSWV